jgi:hypothetical protein
MIGFILSIAPWLLKAAPVLEMIKGKSKIIGIVLAGITILGFYLYVNGLQNRVEELVAAEVAYVAQAQQCQATNDSNQSAILELRAANTSLAAAIEVSENKRWEAIQLANARMAKADAALDDTLNELERLRHANPTCEELSNIDMGVACPLVIERLREHAAGNIGRD